MKVAALVIALSGMAGHVSAQNFSLSIVAPSTGTTGSFTVDIYGDSDFGTHMLGGGFGLVVDAHCGTIENITWSPAQWSSFNEDGGYAGDGVYNTVIFGQLIIDGIPPFDVPAAGSELGQLIGSFQIQLTSNSDYFDGELNLVEASPYSLEVYDSVSGETRNSSEGNLTLYGAHIYNLVCPTPSTCGLFALSALGAARRRRP